MHLIEEYGAAWVIVQLAALYAYFLLQKLFELVLHFNYLPE